MLHLVYRKNEEKHRIGISIEITIVYAFGSHEQNRQCKNIYLMAILVENYRKLARTSTLN